MDAMMATLSRIEHIRALGPGARSAAGPTAGSASDFAALLADAQTASTGAPATQGAPGAGAYWTGRPAGLDGPAGVGGVGAAGSAGAATGVWPNGRIPASALTPIGGGHRLAAPAAAAYGEMAAAARADGISFSVNDSYRSYEQQVDMARRKGLYSEGGLAARPGTSQHGLGMAVDLDLNGDAQAWMRANGARFGFVEDVPREPWHWTFKGR
jgi:D-alanyl-D-alanine carboxypeptidase